MANSLNEILKQSKQWFEYAVTSSQYQKWKELAQESYAFYDGRQWTEAELEALKGRKQPAITVNKIAPKIDNVSGVENTSRTIVTYAPRNFDQDSRGMAEAFTEVAMNWQEREDVAYKNSQSFKDMLKCGLGWVQATKDQNSFFLFDSVDPYEMVWDVDDTTPDFSNQRFSIRHRYLDFDELMMLFPKKEAEITELMTAKKEIKTQRTSFNNTDTKGSALDSYLNDNGSKLLVVEVQYRERKKFYSYLDDLGRTKLVTSEKEAKKMKSEESTVQELYRYVTKYAQYSADILLAHGMLSEQDEQFEFIPMVYKREKQLGVPYGVIENAKDSQREINKRRSKMMHFLNTAQVLVDEEVTDIQDYDRLKKEASQPDGVIAGKGIKLNTNLDLAQGQQIVYNQSNAELEGVMGVYDESLGQETNASSGVAIQRRQSATLRTQSTAFDQFRQYKKRLGRKLMSMIQDIKDQSIIVKITKDEENPLSVILNEPYEVNGKTIYANDVTTANFDILVEESVQYDAPPAEAAERVMNIVMNGQGALLANPELLKVLGVKNSDEIAKVLAQQPSPEQQAQDGNTQTGGV